MSERSEECAWAHEKKRREGKKCKKGREEKNASFAGLEEKKMRAAKNEQRHDTPWMNSVC